MTFQGFSLPVKVPKFSAILEHKNVDRIFFLIEFSSLCETFKSATSTVFKFYYPYIKIFEGRKLFPRMLFLETGVDNQWCIKGVRYLKKIIIIIKNTICRKKIES